MAPRPQAAPSAGLRRTRPDDHAFAPAGSPQSAATPANPVPDGTAASRNGGTAASRNGGTAASRNGGTAASRNGGTAAAATAPQEALVKISTRIPPAVHRFIKVVCAEEDLTTQGIAVDALIAHLEKLGHPLPDDLLQMLHPLH